MLRRNKLVEERDSHPSAPLRRASATGLSRTQELHTPKRSALPRGSRFHRRLPHGGNHVDGGGRGQTGHRGQGRPADLEKGGGLGGGKRKTKERLRLGKRFAASSSSSGRYHLSRQHPGRLPTPPTFNTREIPYWLTDWVLSAHAHTALLTLGPPSSRPLAGSGEKSGRDLQGALGGVGVGGTTGKLAWVLRCPFKRGSLVSGPKTSAVSA
ncbi:uncharacterized protein LOC107974423 [Pan troglodytes]|uniref:uncharacterized protein LOC107974423 n=1 Tax=Pan troglodytes TaxID=9598 RepID=UPI0007DB98C6|nr:uncharacterized protein LOC107974423 [Pan troglodytes]